MDNIFHRLCADWPERSSEKLQRFDDDVQDQGEKRGPNIATRPSMATSNTGSSIPTIQSIIQRIGAPLDSDHALTNPNLITILASGGDVPIGDCGASADAASGGDATKPALSLFPLQ